MIGQNVRAKITKIQEENLYDLELDKDFSDITPKVRSIKKKKKKTLIDWPSPKFKKKKKLLLFKRYY